MVSIRQQQLTAYRFLPGDPQIFEVVEAEKAMDEAAEVKGHDDRQTDCDKQEPLSPAMGNLAAQSRKGGPGLQAGRLVPSRKPARKGGDAKKPQCPTQERRRQYPTRAGNARARIREMTAEIARHARQQQGNGGEPKSETGKGHNMQFMAPTLETLLGNCRRLGMRMHRRQKFQLVGAHEEQVKLPQRLVGIAV